jgi:hypothetical protein
MGTYLSGYELVGVPLKPKAALKLQELLGDTSGYGLDESAANDLLADRGLSMVEVGRANGDDVKRNQGYYVHIPRLSSDDFVELWTAGLYGVNRRVKAAMEIEKAEVNAVLRLLGQKPASLQCFVVFSAS